VTWLKKHCKVILLVHLTKEYYSQPGGRSMVLRQSRRQSKKAGNLRKPHEEDFTVRAMCVAVSLLFQ